MALLTTLNRISYTADGVLTAFAYPFKIFLTADLEVYDNNVLQTSGYTVSGVGQDSGGNVVFAVAPISGHSILIVRVEPSTQASILPASGPFPSTTVEKMADKLTMLVQQLQEVDSRALKLAVTSVFKDLILPDPSANLFLRWKADLTGLEGATVVGQGSIGLPIGITDGGTGGTTIPTARVGLKISSQTSIVAAATLPVTEDTYQLVSGNTGITALATQQVGTVVLLRFTGTPIVTHNGTNLILLGAVNYQVAAGDLMLFVSEGSGNWREIWRRPVTGATSLNFLRGDGIWSALPAAVLAPARGSIFGLALSNNGADATNDIDSTAGECASDDATAANRVLIAPGALTKQLDAAWVVGTNQGMRDTGAISDATWHIFAIQRTDTGVSDILASLSATAPTMPTNYTKKRRIGSILRVGGIIVGFVQDGDYFRRKASVLDINVTNPGTAAVTRTLSVPTGINVFALINALTASSTTAAECYLSDLATNDEAASLTAAPLSTLGQANGSNDGESMVTIRTNTSAQIRSRLNGSDANTALRIATLGWIDRRGRDA